MRYEWDEGKRKANLEKHGLDFEDAYIVCEDPLSVDIIYYEGGEERCNTIGALGSVIVAVVTHTDRFDKGEVITRIISFRKAEKKERREYENGNC
jgi:uncharacterized DUF497 family protein